MLRYVVQRMLWMVPTLFGITMVTFLLLDLVPLDRAELEVRQGAQITDRVERAAAVRALRERYGAVDPKTGRERPFWERYGRWLSCAARLDFASGTGGERLRDRFASALSVTFLLGSLAFLASLFVGVTLGAWLGARAGGILDRVVSAPLLVLNALPEFLFATLAVLLLAGGLWAPLLPAAGLRSPGSDAWGSVDQAVDLLRHLALPVATLAIGPTVTIVRYVRESVARNLDSGFADALRAWGTRPNRIRGRVLRNSLGPLATQLGILIPTLLTGAVVVEQVFAIPGFGRLALQAMLDRDVATVMAATLVSSILVLAGLLLSDLLHRALDPRVELR